MSLRDLLDFVSCAVLEYRRRRSRRLRAAAFFAFALAFNRGFTYARDPGLWMCPSCNRIHEKLPATAESALAIFLAGRRFPACCGFPEGNRLDPVYATDTDYRLPEEVL